MCRWARNRAHYQERWIESLPVDASNFTTRGREISLDEHQYQSFYSQGYLQLDTVLEGAFLSRVQEEFHRVEEETRDDWLRTVANNPKHRPYRLGETAHVVFPVAPYGDVFLDLLEHPRTIAIAEAFMGPDMLMSDNALHVKPAGTPSHVGWHRDSKSWQYEEAWSREAGLGIDAIVRDAVLQDQDLLLGTRRG